MKDIKYNLIFTLDYEIHGNGDGSPYDLMVEPTYRLMNLLEKYGAKLTILADVAEILCFKKYFETTGDDKFYYKQIVQQLMDAIKRGHDVQLHIHSSYFKAEYKENRWVQFADEYNLAALPKERIDVLVKTCIDYLNDLLKPINSNYACHVFRAANWSMMPTKNLYDVVVKYGIDIDTSVYKGGCQGGNVSYDYRDAYDNLLSYTASSENINFYEKDAPLIEYPIYTEMRYFWNFISFMRVFRMVRAKFHKHNKSKVITSVSAQANANDNRKLSLKSFFIKSPWKLDFNQATTRQMISALKRIMKRRIVERECVDVILIGHSKTFIPYNEQILEVFLQYANNQKQVRFGLFSNVR